MKGWFKKLLIPSGEETEVIAYKSWIVRWKSLNHRIQFAYEGKEEVEIFPSKEDAHRFADALVAAYKLLRYNEAIFRVKVEENQSKLTTQSQ